MLAVSGGLCCACCDDCCVKDWKCSNGGCEMLCKFNELTTSTTKAREASGSKPPTPPLAVRFFEDTFPFSLIVKRPATRVASIVVCLALLAAAVSAAVRIEAQTSSESFLPDDHPFQRCADIT